MIEILLDAHNDIIVPLAGEVVQSLFGCDIPKKKRNEEENDDDNDDADAVDGTGEDAFANNRATISHSCMQGYKSAIAWFYGEKGLSLEPTLNSWCDNFINGYKKTVADKKWRRRTNSP